MANRKWGNNGYYGENSWNRKIGRISFIIEGISYFKVPMDGKFSALSGGGLHFSMRCVNRLIQSVNVVQLTFLLNGEGCVENIAHDQGERLGTKNKYVACATIRLVSV